MSNANETGRATDAAKHTPGPWGDVKSVIQMSEGYSQPFGIIQLRANGGICTRVNLIAGIFGDVHGGKEVAKANARLISCAPELLDKLENLLLRAKDVINAKPQGMAHALDNLFDAGQLAEVAINKAEGRE